jgi:signal transduction histidine kinase
MTTLKRIYGPMIDPRTYLEVLYLVAGLVFGILWFVVLVTLYAVGVSTIIVWVGVLIIVGTQALLRPIGVIERAQVRLLLGQPIPAPEPLAVKPATGSTHPRWASLVRRSSALCRDAHSWRVAAWTGFRLLMGPIGFAFAVLYVVVALALLLAPLGMIDFGGDHGYVSPWILWLGPLAFPVVTPALAWTVRGLADLHRLVASPLLGPDASELHRRTIARASRAEEQIRIDQELHDSIGHMVSMIVVQAGAGAHVFDQDPAFAKRALRNIEERGRSALGELDRIIARIRGGNNESHTPLPGAADLADLLDGARDAGVKVGARLALSEVPPAVGRGIYRVIQEALTNAAKHAPGSTVDVAVIQDMSLVAVSVTNTTTHPVVGVTNGGSGLQGIRDRVSLLGGHATVGPRPKGGFAVRAILPFDEMLPEGADVDCTLTGRCTCRVCTIVRRSAR